MAVTGISACFMWCKKYCNLLDPFYVCLARKIHKPLGMAG